LPATTGGEISTLNILKYLSHVHKVSVFTVQPYSNNFNIGTARFELIFGMPFKQWRYAHLPYFFEVRKLANKVQANWIFFDQPWMGWLLILLRLFTPYRLFLRSNNIEYLRFKTMNKWYWPLLRIYEKWTYKAANLVVFVSEEDRLRAIQIFGLDEQHTLLTPYGIDVESQPKSSTEQETINLKHALSLKPTTHIILFFATLSYYPNAEAVQFILDEIYPRLKQQMKSDWHIVICGKGLSDQLISRIEGINQISYKGFVEDIHTYIDAASIMINPILSGGGVKTKAIDTLARAQRVVSTVTGAEGIDRTVCGDCLHVVKDFDWDTYVSVIVDQIDKDKNLHNSFKSTYEWPGIISNLTQKLKSYA
jgi:glycosyltransferase involved in cell wall biosynthesis